MSPETVQDVLCLGVPAEINPRDYLDRPTLQKALGEALSRQAVQAVWAQWKDPVPKDVKFESIDWLITNRQADIDAFQPAHDCADCWMGNLQAEEFLKTNPGRWVAMANLTYTVTW